MRETTPSGLPGCRSVFGRSTYVTCLDCGQKFAYNHKSRRLIDFWGIQDPELRAEVHRRVDKFFSPLHHLAASIGRLNARIPVSEFVRLMHRFGILTKAQWTKSRRLLASKWPSRSNLKQMQTRPENK